MKKLSMLLLTLVCAFALAACGGGNGGAETEAEPADGTSATDVTSAADVTSANGVITVTPAEGFTAVVSNHREMITLQPEGADSAQANYIEIEGPGPDGCADFFKLFTTTDEEAYLYDEDLSYSQVMLRADIENYSGYHPGIFAEPSELTIGSYTYYRCDCVTNGEDSYYYFTVVDEKPYTVSVVDGDLLDIDGDAVTQMMESLVFTY